jgi:hypothetical protein
MAAMTAKGRKDGRIADLVNRLYGDSDDRAASVAGQMVVAGNILDDDDCVVDQYADREDQGEKG